MDVRAGLWRKLSTEELILFNCGVGEDSWVTWTARRSSPLILMEICPEYSLEGLMLKLKLQYLCHLMWRTDFLEKTLTVGKIEGRRRRAWQRMRWLDGIIDSMEMSLSKAWDLDREPDNGQGTQRAAVHGVAKSQTGLSDWTDWLTHQMARMTFKNKWKNLDTRLHIVWFYLNVVPRKLNTIETDIRSVFSLTRVWEWGFTVMLTWGNLLCDGNVNS